MSHRSARVFAGSVAGGNLFGIVIISAFFVQNGAIVQKITNRKARKMQATNPARLKPQYAGKLIYAQSGTGKTTVADNIDVFDSDYLLGQVLEVSTETAGFFFKTLSAEQKKVFGQQYRDLIRWKVAGGKTVLTANASMLDEADVEAYNKSAEQAEERANRPGRAINNLYSALDYHKGTINQINQLKQNESNKEYIELDEGSYLGDYLMADTGNGRPADMAGLENELQGVPDGGLGEAAPSRITRQHIIGSFLKEFGITADTLEDYNGELPLFDALNRAINARNLEEITDGVGYAIAFMMQGDPEMQKIFMGSLGYEGDLGTKLRKVPFTKKRLTVGTVSQGLKPDRDEVIRKVGRQIASELRLHFGEEASEAATTKGNKSIWGIIKNFVRKLAIRIFVKAPRQSGAKTQTDISLFVSDIIEALGREDFSRIRGPRIKPGTAEQAQMVNVEAALENNPFEEGIIRKLGDNGIALAGSASIALEGELYRPSENPLHDIDFATPDNTTKKELDTLLPKIFGKGKVAFVSGNNNKELKNALSKIDEAVRTGNWTDEAIEELENLNLGDYGNILERFSQEELRAGNGTLAQAEAIISRGEASANSREAQKDSASRNAEQESQIEAWAKENGLWYNDYQEAKDGSLESAIEAAGGIFSNDSSSESMVYTTDADHVYKAIDASHYVGSPQKLLDKIILHNAMFPETAMEVTGFGVSRDGKFRVAVKQKYVEGRETAPDEISKLAKNMGLTKKGGRYYTKDGKRITDLNPKNVIKAPDGTMFVIDCDIEFTREHLDNAGPYSRQDNDIQYSMSNSPKPNDNPTTGNAEDGITTQLISHLKEILRPLGLGVFGRAGMEEFFRRHPDWRVRVQEAMEQEKEMQAIREQAVKDGRIVLKEDGTFDYALAPNGRKSNLNERQWLQVRTKNFLNWFGDWINDPENASKVVDGNGEPLVVYHGSDAKFTIFSKTDVPDGGHWFHSNPAAAATYTELLNDLSYEDVKHYFINNYNAVVEDEPVYGENKPPRPRTLIKKNETAEERNQRSEAMEEYYKKLEDSLIGYKETVRFRIGNDSYQFNEDTYLNFLKSNHVKDVVNNDLFFKSDHVRSFFLNIRNETFVDANYQNWNNIYGQKTRDIVKNSFNRNRDGVRISNVNDLGKDAKFIPFEGAVDYSTVFVVRKSNQAKSATDNDGGFSPDNDDIHMFIGKKARTRFGQSLRKARPDMSDAEIQSTLDFLHSLEDGKENAAYIKTAIRWVANRSITFPQDHERAYQAFELARKKNVDIQKYKTLGELITAPEMQPKKRGRKAFDPDTAKTFSNKRTVTTEGGRVFTVYDVEDTEEGQEEVCKALAAHYEMSPWCLSTFTTAGRPTESAKHYWNRHDALHRKIAFENGKPVAFNSDEPDIRLNGFPVVRDVDGVTLIIQVSPVGDNLAQLNKMAKEGLVILSKYEEGLAWPTEKGERLFIIDTDREAWWDMANNSPQGALSDSIVSDPEGGWPMEEENPALAELLHQELGQREMQVHIQEQEAWEAMTPEERDEAEAGEAPDYDLPFFLTDQGEVYGFVDRKGHIFLDETVISPEHPIHEYTHLWDRIVAKKNPKLWKRGVQLMKQTSLWKEMENDPNYGQRWKALSGMTDAKLESLIASEVHARFVGEGGRQLLDNLAKEKGAKGIIGKLKQWILDFWKDLKATFSYFSDEEIQKLTLKDFNHMTLRDFADAVNFVEAPSFSEFQDITPEQVRQAKDLLRNKIKSIQRQIGWIEERRKWNKATIKQLEELTKLRQDLAMEQGLYDGLDTGASTIIINGYGVPQVTTKDSVRGGTITTQNVTSISNKTKAYGVEIIKGSKEMVAGAASWQQQHPQGIVAYRKYSGRPQTFTPATVGEGWIGNPFSIENKGATTVQQFYEWLVTGDNFGNALASEDFRQAVLKKILSTPENSPILYYTELGRPSHATVIGYLVNNKHLLTNRQQPLPGPETKINIWAGTNENADLSNFAERPFTIEGVSFESVGQGFHIGKFEILKNTINSTYSARDNAYKKVISQINGIQKQLENIKRKDYGNDAAYEAGLKRVSNIEIKAEDSDLQYIINGFFSKIKIEGLANWENDATASKIMKMLLKASFEQTPQALQKLLATGNATLTHTQDKGKWGTELPRLLMEVRDELRNGAQQTSPETNVSSISNKTQEAGEEFKDGDTINRQNQSHAGGCFPRQE